jgi:NitT/TauT family transport system ATP-binding protein/nitrate/nitrite transport system substrate-binding protein
VTSPSVLRLGLLRLTDAAPLIVARELGFFAAEGLDTMLSVEPSWANVADKLGCGLLDGAVMLPPLALAISLGLRGSARAEPLVVPSSISLNGNTVTLAEPWASAVLVDGADVGDPARTARRFASVLAERRHGRKPVLAVVHTYSTHNFLLRYWLAAGGVDPDRDVVLTVLPPAQTPEAMRAGEIDGFCAGAPWGEVAARAGLGRAVATSHGIWNNGPEKIFAVRREIAETQPDRLRALLRALLQAGRFCDVPENADHIATILARDTYVGLDPDIIRSSLPGAAALRPAGAAVNADASVFFANAATFPWRSHALWFLREMARWGYLDRGEGQAAAATYRPDLYAEAAKSLDMPVPAADVKSEGTHAGPWSLPAAPVPIPMGADRFLNGARFDPAGSAAAVF